MPKLHPIMHDPRAFAAAYHEARRRERWTDPDDVVRALPRVAATHPHAAEWRIRAITLERIIGVVRPFGRGARVLDVGCGNGWMSAAIARTCGATVHGVDVTEAEIDQARTAWHDISGVTFSLGSIPSTATSMEPVDVVVFAASLQYFADARRAVEQALAITRSGGLVIVADTPWYDASTIEDARSRSRAHYASIGVPDMTEHYFHHDRAQLNGLDVRTMRASVFDRMRWFVRYRARPLFPLLLISRP